MNTNYGDTILKIKKMKNLSDKEIYSNTISKSNYYRILNNEEFTISTLLAIIENLGISTQEFFFIHNEYELDVFTRFIDDIHNNYTNININDKQAEFQLKYHTTKRIVYKKLVDICYLLKMIETNDIDTKFIEQFKFFLLNQNEFTYQELLLLDIALPLLDLNFVITITHKITNYTALYSELHIFKTHIYFFLFDLIYYFLKHKKIDYALKIWNEIHLKQISEKYIGIRLYYYFLENFIDLSKFSQKKIDKVLIICKTLNLDYLHKKFNHIKLELK